MSLAMIIEPSFHSLFQYMIVASLVHIKQVFLLYDMIQSLTLRNVFFKKRKKNKK